MALTVRYFATAAAGAGDGTTWANRAQLVNGATWSTVLTGFGFNANAMRAEIGPGTHSPTAVLTSGLFANAPTIANPLIMVGCDANGVELSVPSPGWTSAQPDFDDSAFPIIATTTNITTLSLANLMCNFIKFTASGCTTNNPLTSLTAMNWCSIYVSGVGGTTLISNGGAGRLTNCQIITTATAFRAAQIISGPTIIDNVRFRGNGTANTGSGNRHGLEQSAGSGTVLRNVTVYGFDGSALTYTGSSAAQTILMDHCTFANCRGTLVLCNSTASQSIWHIIRNCMLTGGGTTSGIGYGIDAQSAAYVLLGGCRVDRNGSGNFNGFGNYPTDLPGMYTAVDTDANEYVSPATDSTADFRINANTSNIWGKGYGVADQQPGLIAVVSRTRFIPTIRTHRARTAFPIATPQYVPIQRTRQTTRPSVNVIRRNILTFNPQSIVITSPRVVR